MRFVRPILALVAPIAAFTAASPAAADDGRRHVMTPTQRIDMVRDLPDIHAFERDGQYFDLGYMYPVRIVNGASVASSSPGGEAGYVLYHDDYYVRADAGILAELGDVLGEEDPTQGYTPPVAARRSSGAAADPWGANGSDDDSIEDRAKGQPIASLPASGGSSARRGSGLTIGTLFLLFVVLFIRFRMFRDLVVGGVLAGIAAVARRRAEPEFGPGMAVATDRLASQAAAQRARLDGLAGAPGTPAPGGFGRKQG